MTIEDSLFLTQEIRFLVSQHVAFTCIIVTCLLEMEEGFKFLTAF